MEKLIILLRFTRWSDWILNIGFVLFGYFLSKLSYYIILPAIILVFFFVESFGFAINEYFDAPFDKIKPATKNVISKCLLSKSNAAIFCTFLFFVGLINAFLLLPVQSFIPIVLLYIVFLVYSSPPFRFKEKALVGIITHGIFVPLLLLASYLSVSPINASIILFSICTFLLSILVGITQEIRDMDVDRKSGFKPTAIMLGYKNSLNLIRLIFLSAIILFVITVIIYMPLYLLLLMISSVFYLKLIFGKPNQKELYKKTLSSWDKGIVVLFIIGFALLPLYLQWI